MTLEELIKEAQNLEKAGKYTEALDFYCRAIDQQPNQPDLYSWRGVVYFHLDRKEDALKDMDRAILLQPDYSYRYSSRAFIRASLKMTKEAIEDYKKCIELDPEDAIAYNNLGLLEEQLGWNEQAKQNFKKADELEGILLENGIDSEKEQQRKEKVQNQEVIEQEVIPETTKGRIIKDVFTKKSTFKEFINFIKNGFKLNDE